LSGIDARRWHRPRADAEAEAEAVRRGCHAAALDTFSFQARGFYEAAWLFGVLDARRLPTWPSPLYLTKRLGGSQPPS